MRIKSLFLFWQLTFLSVNFTNITEATEAMYFIGGNVMLITKYITFYYYQQFVVQVKDGLQDILDKSNYKF